MLEVLAPTLSLPLEMESDPTLSQLMASSEIAEAMSQLLSPLKPHPSQRVGGAAMMKITAAIHCVFLWCHGFYCRKEHHGNRMKRVYVTLM